MPLKTLRAQQGAASVLRDLRQNDMDHYWLYILKHELRAEGGTLALSASALDPKWGSGKLQTTNYRSWEQLSRTFVQAGIDPEIIRSSKAILESEGFHTVWDVSLSEEQLRVLGFGSTEWVI